MPNITQFISRALPEATRLPRVPAGGFAQPVAEGLSELSAGVQKFAQARQKAIDDFEQAKQKIAEDTERSQKSTELYQGLGELDDSLKGITNSKEHEVLSKKGLIDLKNRMISTTGNPVVRQELINDLNPRFERLFVEKYKPEADKILFNNAMTAKIEEKEKLRPTAIFNQGTPEGDEARDKIILGFVDLRDAGLITPQKALEGQMELLKDIDLFRAQRDLESDPTSIVFLSEEELLKKYSNLTTQNYFKLISDRDKVRNDFLEQKEKNDRDGLLSNLREKATNKQVSHKQLDRIRNEGRLKAGEYSTVRTLLDENLKVYKDVFTNQLTASLEAVGEQDKIKLQSTVFEATREFELRAKRLDTITEEGNEYYELMQDMLEKYTPILFGGELISITPFPEGTIRPGEPQTTTTPTTTGKMSKEKSPTPTATDKIPREKTPTASIWTEERIISALKAGEITMDEAASLQDDLLLKESKRAPVR